MLLVVGGETSHLCKDMVVQGKFQFLPTWHETGAILLLADAATNHHHDHDHPGTTMMMIDRTPLVEVTTRNHPHRITIRSSRNNHATTVIFIRIGRNQLGIAVIPGLRLDAMVVVMSILLPIITILGTITTTCLLSVVTTLRKVITTTMTLGRHMIVITILAVSMIVMIATVVLWILATMKTKKKNDVVVMVLMRRTMIPMVVDFLLSILFLPGDAIWILVRCTRSTASTAAEALLEDDTTTTSNHHRNLP